MIEVEYDGEFPGVCGGTLKITVDGKVIYEEKFACYSTGYNGYDEEEEQEILLAGDIRWKPEEAEKFSKEIQEAVYNKLQEHGEKRQVCCGGCI